MTETQLSGDESLPINAPPTDPRLSRQSLALIGASFFIIFLLGLTAVVVISGLGSSETAATDSPDPETTTEATNNAALVRGDEVQVKVGPSGHSVSVACFLPAAGSPPLVVFASSAPTNLDLRAEATLFDSTESAYQTVVRADGVRPGEQREAVPRTRSADKVVVQEQLTDCRIDSVQIDRQIVRFR